MSDQSPSPYSLDRTRSAGSGAPAVRRSGATPMMSEAETRSLDLVQRIIFSSLIVVVFGSLAAVLALYIALTQDQSSRSDTLVLWGMTGLIGLVTAAGVLLINRRRPYAPWVLLGLLPMAISAYWIF